MNSKAFDVHQAVVRDLPEEKRDSLKYNQDLYQRIRSVLVTEDDIEGFVPDDVKASIRTPKSFEEEFLNEPEDNGLSLPWEKMRAVKVAPGELTLWAGYNEHRKSLIASFVMMHYASIGEKVCIASLEMQPRMTLKRMFTQAMCTREGSNDYKVKFLNWLDGKLFIYDQLDSVSAERIQKVVAYCAQELGITHILIDSLMTIEIDGDDYKSQREFLRALARLAKQYEISIHLITHLRKPSVDYTRFPNRYDISGSGNISDLAHNVLIVWVNEKRYEELKKPEDKQEEKNLKGPDMIIALNKCRNRGGKGKYAFQFHERSLQPIEYKPITYWSEFE